jgi:hypothetical protein
MTGATGATGATGDTGATGIHRLLEVDPKGGGFAFDLSVKWD